jgi:hypothetical protein
MGEKMEEKKPDFVEWYVEQMKGSLDKLPKDVDIRKAMKLLGWGFTGLTILFFFILKIGKLGLLGFIIGLIAPFIIIITLIILLYFVGVLKIKSKEVNSNINNG